MDTVRKDYGQYERCTPSYLEQLRQFMPKSAKSSEQKFESNEPKLNAIAVDFAVTSATLGRKRFFTKKNFMGIGPPGMKPDDLVYVFAGGPVPFVLRRDILPSRILQPIVAKSTNFTEVHRSSQDW
ncbi:hypothetical protein B0T25DRAFT_356694 [Lasiosphaeria hispida]|uniref:Uncharacterized protein n=1 Tax=Lasiosphaeria hispida TaxID=260671 RepID=A0AAJ0H7C2_9PEZI|nr:hypothetical protein B0T25DRAFT_356694 [Lasiosphaeria hispida]